MLGVVGLLNFDGHYSTPSKIGFGLSGASSDDGFLKACVSNLQPARCAPGAFAVLAH